MESANDSGILGELRSLRNVVDSLDGRVRVLESLLPKQDEAALPAIGNLESAQQGAATTIVDPDDHTKDRLVKVHDEISPH